MQFRKFTLIWTLLALLLGQIAFAEHSAVHIDHGFSIKIASSHNGHEHDHHHHDHKKEQKDQKHDCSVCVLTDTFQTAFYHTPVLNLISAELKSYQFAAHKNPVIATRYKSNSARAPPTNLI